MFDRDRAAMGGHTYVEVASYLGTSVVHLESWLHGDDWEVVSPETFLSALEWERILSDWGRGGCQ